MFRFALLVQNADGSQECIDDLIAFRWSTVDDLKAAFRNRGGRVLAVVRSKL